MRYQGQSLFWGGGGEDGVVSLTDLCLKPFAITSSINGNEFPNLSESQLPSSVEQE